MRLLLIALLVALSTDAYNILIFHHKFSYSVNVFLGNIADTLVDAGHNVTMLTSDIEYEYHDCTQRSKIIRVAASEATTRLHSSTTGLKSDVFRDSIFDPIKAYMLGSHVGELHATQCEAVLDEPGLIERLKRDNYDVMIVEHFELCGLALSHLLQPKALISSLSSALLGPTYAEFGVPQITSYDPSIFVMEHDVHSFWSRLKNLYASCLEHIWFQPRREMIESLFRGRFGGDFPSMRQIASNAAYVFVYTEPLIDYATPTMTKVVHLGGIGVKKPKPLDEEWEEILQRRDKTVLLSFGSFIKSVYFSQDVKESILNMMKTFPEVTFIWKYEEDDEFSRNVTISMKNIVMKSWMPQVDILSHPRLSAFITHGGMASTQETATLGVPGIFIPLFADQPRNAGMMQFNKLGKVLSKFDIINTDKFIAVVKEVLEDESYRRNSRHISAKLKRKPFSARELLIKHVEFAAEFGPSPALRPQFHDMNWIEYSNCDILAVVVILVLIIVNISSIVCRRLLSMFVGKKKVD